MAEYITYLDNSNSPEGTISGSAWCSLEVIVEYTVSGGWVRAGRDSPPEYPIVEIECYRIPKTLAELLGCKEVLDSEKVEAYVDMDSLYNDLLQAWQDEEPDF